MNANKLNRVLVTGANGFIGNALIKRMATDSRFKAIGTVRDANSISQPDSVAVVTGELNADSNWSRALNSIDVVVHTAARVHLMRDSADDPLKQYREVNVAGTMNLARQAFAAGVRRFVFLSTIKVNGETTVAGEAFAADDQPVPVDAYAVSKAEAEANLRQLAQECDMEVVIIRAPLVYGPGVKANFHKLMCWIDRGIPLPLGAIHNRRSLVALDNLVDLVITCTEHPAAANQIFLAADGEDMSTSELLSRLAQAQGKSPRLVPVPAGLLNFLFYMLGRKALAQRLCQSLRVDITKTRTLLGWQPPVSVTEALQRTVADFEC